VNKEDASWAFLRGYYFPKFLIVIKSLEWDERYEWLKAIYNDKYPEAHWEERSEDPIRDMMEYVARKDYFHFFCMAVSVQESVLIRLHRMLGPKQFIGFSKTGIK
jgi:hypothetical protein